ncbi:uncharacterized protein LOC144144020 [Haemaphysalis longicornis]
MKGLFLCAIILAAAMFVQAKHEVCGLNNAQIKTTLSCMAGRVPTQLRGKATDIVRKQGDNLAALIKRECDADVDFSEVLKRLFTEEEAEFVKKAFKECRPNKSRG